MPQYSPPPTDLSKLNPIQRYLQKGSLERQDWIGLIILVIVYFMARPYIEKAAAWWMGSAEGAKAQREYQERRAAAKVGANTVRGTEQKNVAIEELATDDQVVSSARSEDKSKVVNRKTKGQKAAKSHEENLVDWDDEPVASTGTGEQADVMKWLDKWDKEAETIG